MTLSIYLYRVLLEGPICLSVEFPSALVRPPRGPVLQWVESISNQLLPGLLTLLAGEARLLVPLLRPHVVIPKV